jgi:hypothetical protein
MYAYLRRKDVLNFTSSDTKRQGSKRTMRGRVRVTTYGNTTRQSETLLGADNVNDSLAFIGKGKVFESEIVNVLFQLHDLSSTGSLLDKGFDIDELASVRRGHIVIDSHKSAVGSPHGATGETEAFKCLGRGNFVNQVAIDVDKRRHTVIVDQMVVPDLVTKRSLASSSRQGGGRLKCVATCDGEKSRDPSEKDAQQRSADAISHGYNRVLVRLIQRLYNKRLHTCNECRNGVSKQKVEDKNGRRPDLAQLLRSSFVIQLQYRFTRTNTI